MRAETDAGKIRRLMERLGQESRGAGRIYFTGGATAVLLGWLRATIDVDLNLDPEPPGVFEALARLKNELDMNVELAAPDDFLPPLRGWRERSRLIDVHGGIEFLHYDFYGQALAKIERGHTQDLLDVRELISRGLVERSELRRLFDEIEPLLIRYPAIDPESLRARVEEGTAAAREGGR